MQVTLGNAGCWINQGCLFSVQVAIKNDEQGIMYFETVVPQEVLA